MPCGIDPVSLRGRSRPLITVGPDTNCARPGLLSWMNPKRSSTADSRPPRPVTPEQIAALAHELWQERGCPEGSDVDIWLEAERELNGLPAVRGHRDPIPADPDRADADSDPAINPTRDAALPSLDARRGGRSPTAFGL